MTDHQSIEERAHAEIAEVNGAADANGLRIGILTPLTGPGDATAGQLVVRGASLGAAYVRERTGQSVTFSLENDQATAATEGMQRSGVAGLAKLSLIDDVSAVLGQWHLRTTPAVADAAERLGQPIFIENGHSNVTAEGRRSVFRTYFTVAERARMMVEFMAAQRIGRIGVLAADTVFGLSTADALQHYAAEAGMAVLRIDFPQETTQDLRPQLAEIRDFQPDLFVNDGVVRTNYLIVEQAAELGLLPRLPMMVTFGFPMRSADFWRLAGRHGNGTIWPATHYRPSWQGLTEIGRWFTDRYRARYGTFPPDTALSAFTDVTIIARAMQTAGSRDRDGLIESLEAQEFPTWRGPVSFGSRGGHLHHDAPPICLMQYQRPAQDFDQAAIIWPDSSATGKYLPPDALG